MLIWSEPVGVVAAPGRIERRCRRLSSVRMIRAML
jgi:hypothetical protein